MWQLKYQRIRNFAFLTWIYIINNFILHYMMETSIFSSYVAKTLTVFLEMNKYLAVLFHVITITNGHLCILMLSSMALWTAFLRPNFVTFFSFLCSKQRLWGLLELLQKVSSSKHPQSMLVDKIWDIMYTWKPHFSLNKVGFNRVLTACTT